MMAFIADPRVRRVIAPRGCLGEDSWGKADGGRLEMTPRAAMLDTELGGSLGVDRERMKTHLPSSGETQE